jgi:hypothetical protein
VQAVFTDQVRAHTRQVAFVGARESLVQERRHGRLQHGVAEELEAFVVIGTGTAVRQGALQQRRLLESVAEALLQRTETSIH